MAKTDEVIIAPSKKQTHKELMEHISAWREAVQELGADEVRRRVVNALNDYADYNN